METTIKQNNLPNVVALLLVLPAACFISANLLNELGFPAFYQSIEQFIPQQFGFNMNLLILLGPIAALCIAAIQVLRINWQFNKEQAQFGLTIRKKWFPVLVGLFSGLILSALAVYVVVENFNHYNG